MTHSRVFFVRLSFFMNYLYFGNSTFFGHHFKNFAFLSLFSGWISDPVLQVPVHITLFLASSFFSLCVFLRCSWTQIAPRLAQPAPLSSMTSHWSRVTSSGPFQTQVISLTVSMSARKTMTEMSSRGLARDLINCPTPDSLFVVVTTSSLWFHSPRSSSPYADTVSRDF